MPCLSDCSVRLQPCKSREHPSEPVHPLWAQRRHVPPLSSVQPPPSPRILSPNGPAALLARARAAAVRRATILLPSACFLSIPPLAHFRSDARRPVFSFRLFFGPCVFLFAAAVCALVAAAQSLKPPEPEFELNSLTPSCQAYTGTRRRVRARRVKDFPSLRGLSQADVYATAEKCFARIQSRLWPLDLCCSVSSSFSLSFIFGRWHCLPWYAVLITEATCAVFAELWWIISPDRSPCAALS